MAGFKNNSKYNWTIDFGNDWCYEFEGTSKQAFEMRRLITEEFGIKRKLPMYCNGKLI